MAQHPTTTTTSEPEPDQLHVRRDLNRSRHAQALTKLMAEREDLRGVHALADFVADSLKWTA